ncbi:unnamed protein product [Rotaria sp. Silwood2]|nr:unnamed protein product [Rotaria sp. Silwood2]
MDRSDSLTIEKNITSLVLPSPPTGNARRIELAGIDLWLDARIDSIFVYPSTLNLDRFKEALSRTLSRWPLVAGHLLLLDDNRYFIEMADHAIPVFIVDNHDLPQWPFDSTVVVEKGSSLLQPYFSFVQTRKLLNCSPYEPLVQMKITHIIQSNQWVLGISWAHILGDAISCLQFLNTFSRLYQHLEPCKPDPIFERHLWQEKDVVSSFLPMMNLLEDALLPEQQTSSNFIDYLENYAQINLRFSGTQLVQLHKIVGETSVTIHDALTAYIIVLLNAFCLDSDDKRIKHTSIIVNYRGTSESIAPLGQVANAIFRMLSEDFDDPRSLSNVALTIRRSIHRSREIDFLESYLATADCLMRRNTREKRQYRMTRYANEIIVNSNLKYDWADAVDFGYTNQCRFYTAWTGPFYLRVFRLNPIQNGHQWIERDKKGAEVAFLIEKDKKSRLMTAWQCDIDENFARWKPSKDTF